MLLLKHLSPVSFPNQVKQKLVCVDYWKLEIRAYWKVTECLFFDINSDGKTKILNVNVNVHIFR